MPHLRDLALSARSFLRPVTSRRIPLNPDLGYWGGVSFLYQARLTNGGAAGELSVLVIAGEGNEFEALYGTTANRDTVARSVDTIVLTPDAAVMGYLVNPQSIGANVFAHWPTVATGVARFGGNSRFIFSGGMRLLMRCNSVAANQDADFAFVLRVRGDVPTITETFTAGGNAAVNIKELI